MSKTKRSPSRKRRPSGVSFASRVAGMLETLPASPRSWTTAQLSEWTTHYTSVRDVGKALNMRLAQEIQRDGVHFSASYLGMLNNGVVTLGTEDEICVLMDHAIYNYRPGDQNVIERWIAEEREDPSSLEGRWLAAAARSYHTLLLVSERIPGFGCVMQDVFGGNSLLLADKNLSQTGCAGLTLSARVVPFGDYCLTTGAALPITDVGILQELGNYLRRTFGRTEGLRNLPRQQALLLESFITQTCLRYAASEMIRYE